jgi:galactarate dehydratase
MKPPYIRTHPSDNVGLVLENARKIALVDFGAGDAVLRYGQVIGYAKKAIQQGAHVPAEMLELPEAPSLDELDLTTNSLPEPEPLQGFTFEGYRNPDGSVGTRNILAITTTVQCVAPTVDYAVRRLKAEVLPRFANVDDIVALTHTYGCGVAIDAPGAEIPIRTLRNISLHANTGGTPLIVSLGCEKLPPERLFRNQLPLLEAQNVVRLQSHGGFAATVSAIMEAAERRLAVLSQRRRETVPASELVVGMQCGGSDAFSGITCNPAVGFAADLIVRAGGTVLFSEVTEVRDAIHLLVRRAATPQVARDLVREMRWYDDYLARGRSDRSANPTPGNKSGGIANIVEKALGSIAKAGSTPIRAVASHGERVTTKGLVFAATPASDFICGTLQLASMNLHIFTTGEGSPYGLSMVPVIKVSSRSSLAERWHDLIDVDAGPIASGESTTEEIGWEIFRFALKTASGRKKTWAEHWGLGNALTPFNPAPVT